MQVSFIISLYYYLSLTVAYSCATSRNDHSNLLKLAELAKCCLKISNGYLSLQL